MLFRDVHEACAIPDFQDRMHAMDDQLIGACLRHAVRRALDEMNARNMIGFVDEIASIAGRGRSFWRGVL